MVNDITSVELLSQADDGALKDCGFSPGNVIIFKIDKARLGTSHPPGSRDEIRVWLESVGLSQLFEPLLAAGFDNGESLLDLRSLSLNDIKDALQIPVAMATKLKAKLGAFE